MEAGITQTTINLDSDTTFQKLRHELGISSFGINVITFQPGQAGRIHRHKLQEEIYIVLKGQLTLVLDDQTLTLNPNDCVRVAPAARRQLSNTSDAPVVILALGGAGEHVGRDGEAFLSWDDDEPHEPRDVPPGPSSHAH